MKPTLLLFFATLTFFSSLQSQPKLSQRQEKLSVFIKKYQDAIKNATDSLTKVKIYSDMWRKHIIFIQDSLKFSTFTFDTFYFKKANVKYTIDSNKKSKHIEILLDNNNYAAIVVFDITKNLNLQDIPIYKMVTKLKQNMPVMAVMNLQDFFLSDENIDKGFKKIILTITLNSIYNTN